MKINIHCFAAVLFIAVCSGQVTRDPCLPGEHKVLNELQRSTGYDTRLSDTPLSDNRLEEGWYRFRDSNQMPTTCQGNDKCGTTIPIWMNGPHPGVNDGIVNNPLCGKQNKNDPNADCCAMKGTVSVKNCNTFFVYRLKPTAVPSSAYCAGTQKRCPVGKISLTGLEPCTDSAPVLDKLPVVTGPIFNKDKTIAYHCDFEYKLNDHDQFFTITWTFNGKADPTIPVEAILGDKRKAVLSGEKLLAHTDTEVGCTVTTFFLRSPANKNTYSSKPIFFGLKDASVTLTGPNLQDTKLFNFQCEVTSGNDNPNQEIEVVWTFDGKEDPKIKPQIINSRSRKATLPGSALVGHLNSRVGCQARLVFDAHKIKTAFAKSNTYFAGIQVTPKKLELKDSESEKEVTVTSTIPVVCNQRKDCCLTFKLKIENSLAVSLKGSCEPRICFSDWDQTKKQASVKIAVVPSVNGVRAGLRRTTLFFEQALISGTGLYHSILSNYKPDPIEIVITPDAGAQSQCSITGDPHIVTFDKVMFDLYAPGDFIAYSVKERHFEIQIRTWRCWAVYCTCGVVVKEMNNIIRVNGCNRPGNLIGATIGIPYPLSAGTVVQRSTNGQNVGIRLPSGSEVKIALTSMYMNVYINTPAFDKNKAKGICGTNDGNRGNDFTHRDGKVSPLCTASGRCIPVAFTTSWRVNAAESMFVVTPPKVATDDRQFCSCAVSAQGKSEYTCSPKRPVQEIIPLCNNCPVITQALTAVPWARNEGQVIEPDTIAPVDPNQNWPNAQGVTEAVARDMCQKAMNKSPLFAKCQNEKSLLDTAMSECLRDILHGGTTDAIDSSVDLFTVSCQLFLAQNEENLIQGPDGTFVLKPEFGATLCPLQCLAHGQCGKDGKCACQNGWEGETCQIEKGKGPQISRIGGPLCHDSENPCNKVPFDKSNVNIFDKLKCRIQKVDEQGNKIGTPTILNANPDPSPVVICPLPRTEKSRQKYLVAVSTDGSLFGNELPVEVYDPTCINCNSTGCSVKSSSCHINNICRKDGEINKNDKNLKCDVKTNTTAWTRVSEEHSTLTLLQQIFDMLVKIMNRLTNKQ